MALFVEVGKAKKNKLINVDLLVIMESDLFGGCTALTANGLGLKLDRDEFDKLNAFAASTLPGIVDPKYVDVLVGQVKAIDELLVKFDGLYGMAHRLRIGSEHTPEGAAWMKFLNQWGALVGLCGLDDPVPQGRGTYSFTQSLVD